MNGIRAHIEETLRATWALLQCEDTERRCLSVSQEVGSHQTPNLPVL